MLVQQPHHGFEELSLRGGLHVLNGRLSRQEPTAVIISGFPGLLARRNLLNPSLQHFLLGFKVFQLIC